MGQIKINLPKFDFDGVSVGSLQVCDVFLWNLTPYMFLEWDDGAFIKVLNLRERLVTTLRESERVAPLEATLTVEPFKVPNRLTPAEESLVRYEPGGSSGRIQAIKSVRERTGWGLKEAKDFVDAEVVRLGVSF